MKTLLQSLRMLIFMTILTGLIYPLLITGFGQLIFPAQANGQLIMFGQEQQIAGSKLIGQKFASDKYFWSRPSAIDYNPLPSGGSNLGQISADLKQTYLDRKEKLLAAHGSEQEAPQDMLFASASGLDPHISPAAAHYQSTRVARARNIDPYIVENLVIKHTEKRQWGFLGEPRVNVLQLNLALDGESKTQ